MPNPQYIPLCVPNISGNEWNYVKECLDTNWVSSGGKYVHEFEKKFAQFVGSKYAIAVVNGTAALHISLLLSDVQKGDEVLMPNLTFVAPANAVSYCGAKPILLDSNWENLGIDIDKLKKFLNTETTFSNGNTINNTTGAKIKAIIPMHTFGYPVDMDPLKELCKARNIHIIEDATESLGSKYKNIKTGNFGKLACFSFNGNKIMTTGGGGMIVTNYEDLAKKAKHLTTTAKTDPVSYDHDEIGYNYRLVNILAAIGCAQLEKMNDFISIKRNNWTKYNELFKNYQLASLHKEPENVKSNYWMYCLVLKDNTISIPKLITQLELKGIQVRPVWKLMSDLPMFKNCQTNGKETAKEIQNQVLNIPCSTNIKCDEIKRVVSEIKTNISH